MIRFVQRKRGQIKKLPDAAVKEMTQHVERLKASMSAKVEHPFLVVKNTFRYRKTSYRGIAKNENHWQVLFGLARIYMTRKTVMNMVSE